ncbi:Type I restriction-modification system, specificity subunit S [Corynebacterium casei]|uniref:restriction endonuclease subunit S n=1 Tax=Corynebacterium casei TaxID=160386 RepID=UPI0009D12135|nr:restriction endonuclease subunit S [Corynebacterium casei]SLM93871.1 Type I restriction-modification system, specificity subunit S [Corynebacterium casei]
MNNVDQLVEELRPNGVAYFPLGELLDYEQPSKYLVKSVAYNDSYSTPVLTAGQTFILGYTDEADGIYPASVSEPVVIFDDFTTSFKWVDFSFKAKSSAMKILVPKAHVNLRYVWFAMQTIGYKPQDHARQWIGIYSKFRIPVPPLPVQQEIVRKLDMFTQLEAELEAELEARKRQYKFYADSILSISPETDFISLGDLANNLDRMRKPVTRGARTSGEIPYYGASGIVDFVSDYIFDGDYLLVSEDGANLLARSSPIAFSISGKTWVNNHAHVLEFDTYVERRYVEIYLNSLDLSPYISGASQPKLNKANLNRIPIPNPPIKEKTRIVEILDSFKALIDDLSCGLPAEIKARWKQYEYYRDKLLTFEELSV